MTQPRSPGILCGAALAGALGGSPAAAPGQPPDAFAVLTTPPAGAGVCVAEPAPGGLSSARWRGRVLRMASADSAWQRDLVLTDVTPAAVTGSAERGGTYFVDNATHVPGRAGGTGDNVAAFLWADGRVEGRHARYVTPSRRGGGAESPLTAAEVARVRALVAWMRTRCRA